LQPPNVISTGTRLTLPLVSVTLAAAELVGAVAEAAVRVTVRLAGSAGGALYVAGLPLAVPAGLTMPHAGAHGAPFWVSAQVTPLFAISNPTVAVNFWALFSGASAVTGATPTVTAGTVMEVVA
jgi:hypothetical protein